MEAIKKYVSNFQKRKKVNKNYDICFVDLCSAAEEFRHDAWNTLNTIFDYGYAKGYRAAMAEMKKGGAA